MKTYRSTQLREAFKIEEIATLVTPKYLETEGYTRLSGENESVYVNADYMHKHAPSEGGYYVRYPDGYESYCPAESFEAGHEEVTEP